MKYNDSSVLVIGESGVGKTHYGAQLLMKLQKKNAQLQMDGAAKNLEPFSEAMDKLNEGLAAKHTPATSYVESIWPIKDSDGFKGQLIWPDYGGEQVSNISTFRNIPKEWIQRATGNTCWLFMLRTNLYRLQDDILSRPINNDQNPETQMVEKKEISDQARLIELLQILIYLRKISGSSKMPRICFLLSCWDELNTSITPPDLLNQSLPMLYDFIHSHWEGPLIMGLSSLGKDLDKINKDQAYVETGPESFGYVVCPDGTYNPDITIPIKFLIA